MHSDNIRGMLGRLASQRRQLDALSCALHMIEVMWANMTPEQRDRCEHAGGWFGWMLRIQGAINWP